MSIYVAINHQTSYSYDRLINLSPHIIRLRPAPHCRTPIQAYSLRIQPADHFINWQQDAFGNYLARVVFPERTRELLIEVDIVADLTPLNPFDFFVDDTAASFPFAYDSQEVTDLQPYLKIDEAGPRLLEWTAAVDRSEMPIIDFLVQLNQKLYQEVAYSVRMDPGVQSCEETLGAQLGSCRDSGWLLVQILRQMGLAARFVSGYLIQLTADQKALDGPSGPLEDFTDLHAWAEVYIPGAGWVGLDPTSGLFAGEGHIPLACTPSPASAAAVSGFTDPCETVFNFSNSVQRIFEDPRVTKPYTETQWEAINQLGEQVDGELNAGDVRLTLGGEPTFVSIDDMDAAEWNISADGAHKQALAQTLVRRLHHAFGKGGFLHTGQGKWYPGERLPRWKLAAYWRTDGLPVWNDATLFDGQQSDTEKGERAPGDSQTFIERLAEKLGLIDAAPIAAYEDAFYLLWEEGNLPVEIDPLQSDLEDPLERQYLARVLDQGAGNPAGYVLPLAWDYEEEAGAGLRWITSAWPLRRSQLFLIPGSSSMGLRLPLDRLPEPAEDELEEQVVRSSFEELAPLPVYAGTTPDLQQAAPKATTKIVRTALCTEVRDGRLYIFMPPLPYLEQYLQLLAAIEVCAAELAMAVIIEGYEPPADPRLKSILVTPDPGVIEVNIFPSHSWRELVTSTETLYEEARLSRLGTEKFLIDGRHTGTGGGNHVTLGGPTPADSPFLRRPDLLRSLITYWQHHPGLSYLFAGMFVGPTSQSPRVDEGRDERLYELEIAFAQIPDKGEAAAPWLVDRVLRNLLVDITGNTHRAEFCIDKLYSPDSESGRQGLVELRAFDMPPHARMSLVQLLLVRTLISWFWRHPYREPPIRWGTQLHDRFMLPYYVEADLREVVTDLNGAGYDFALDWLAPFFEFRFPRYGTAQIQDVEMELRMAIEPWHVLGEEVGSQGTARYVDSSVERIQLKVKGLIRSRHIVTCNGRPVPLRPTAIADEYVAAIRYQAWQPSSSLHPTIAVQAPLVFDLVDTWARRAIGGCTYHVVHPGGRGYEDIPVNANVAEARRISRFWDYGHTPGSGPVGAVVDLSTTSPPLRRTFADGGSEVGPVSIPEMTVNPEYPHTLDLRRA